RIYLSALFSFTTQPPSVISPLSLHDALPIYLRAMTGTPKQDEVARTIAAQGWTVYSVAPAALYQAAGAAELMEKDYDSVRLPGQDRKSTRLNSSHVAISYAVFCLKKKKNKHY